MSTRELDSYATVRPKGDDLAAPVCLCGGEPRSPPWTGAKALMLAVLDDAVRSYLGCAPRVQAEAERWLSSRRRSLFSFIMICETLGLEPDAVRRALRRMRARQASPKAIGRSRSNVCYRRHPRRLCALR